MKGKIIFNWKIHHTKFTFFENSHLLNFFFFFFNFYFSRFYFFKNHFFDYSHFSKICFSKYTFFLKFTLSKFTNSIYFYKIHKFNFFFYKIHKISKLTFFKIASIFQNSCKRLQFMLEIHIFFSFSEYWWFTEKWNIIRRNAGRHTSSKTSKTHLYATQK